MSDYTDAELCRLLAEVMGWKREPPIDPLPGGWRSPGDEEFYQQPPNPLADTDEGWADFGRVWGWAISQQLSPMMSAFKWRGSQRDNPVDGLGRVRSVERESKGDDGRRALCLAILQAEGRR